MIRIIPIFFALISILWAMEKAPPADGSAPPPAAVTMTADQATPEGAPPAAKMTEAADTGSNSCCQHNNSEGGMWCWGWIFCCPCMLYNECKDCCSKGDGAGT